MSGRGHRHNHHQEHRVGGLPSFFEERSSIWDRSRRGPPVANPPSAPSSDEEVHSDDEIFREIEDYIIEVKGRPVSRLGILLICARIGHPVVRGSKLIWGHWAFNQ